MAVARPDARQIPSPGEWRERSACQPRDRPLFFSFDTLDQRAAKAICEGCGVRAPCLEYATRWVVAGVWGGTSEEDRRKRAREWRRSHGTR